MGKEIDLPDAPQENGNVKEETGPHPPSVEAQLDNSLKLLDRAVRSKDTRLISGRLLRQTAAYRSKLTAEILYSFVEQTLPESFSAREPLLGVLQQVSVAGSFEHPLISVSRSFSIGRTALQQTLFLL